MSVRVILTSVPDPDLKALGRSNGGDDGISIFYNGAIVWENTSPCDNREGCVPVSLFDNSQVRVRCVLCECPESFKPHSMWMWIGLVVLLCSVCGVFCAAHRTRSGLSLRNLAVDANRGQPSSEHRR